MRYFKQIAQEQGIKIKDAGKYGVNGVIMANNERNREITKELMKNPILRITYVGEVIDNNLLYTRRWGGIRYEEH